MILWRKHERNDCFWGVCRYLVCTIKDKPTYLLMICWWLLMFFWIWSLLTSVELLPSSFADTVTLAASQGFKSQIIQNNKSRRSSWLCLQELWSWHVLTVQSGHHQGSWTPLLFLQMLGSGNANGRPIAWDRTHRECVVKWSVVFGFHWKTYFYGDCSSGCISPHYGCYTHAFAVDTVQSQVL